MDAEYSEMINDSPLDEIKTLPKMKQMKMLGTRTPRRPVKEHPKELPPIKAKVLSGREYNHTLVSHTRNTSKDKASFAFSKAKRFSE